MVEQSEEEKKKQAMAAVWRDIEQKAAKKPRSRRTQTGIGARSTAAGRAVAPRIDANAELAKPSPAASDSSKPEQQFPDKKKKFKLGRKGIAAIASAVVACVLIAVGAILLKRHAAYIASPAGQANEIYSTKITDKTALAKKYENNYYEYYRDLYKTSSAMLGTGSATSEEDVKKAEDSVKKWGANDVAKAQFCLIYAGKTDDLSRAYLIYSMMWTQQNDKKADVYPKNLPLDSDKAEKIISDLASDDGE